MFLLFLPRQHVETLKEAKMRDGNLCLQTRLQGKICGFHLIRAESTYMLDGGYFCFCLLSSSNELPKVKLVIMITSKGAKRR